MCFPRAGGDVPRVLETQELQEALARLKHSQRSGRKRRADRAAAEAESLGEGELAEEIRIVEAVTDEEEGLDQADRPVVPGVSSRADRASGRASRASALKLDRADRPGAPGSSSRADRASSPASRDLEPVVLDRADRPGVPGHQGLKPGQPGLCTQHVAGAEITVASGQGPEDRHVEGRGGKIAGDGRGGGHE